MRFHLFLLLKCSKNKACDMWDSTSGGKKTCRKMLNACSTFLCTKYQNYKCSTIQHNEKQKIKWFWLGYTHHKLVSFTNVYLDMLQLKLKLSFNMCLTKMKDNLQKQKIKIQRRNSSLKLSYKQHFQS